MKAQRFGISALLLLATHLASEGNALAYRPFDGTDAAVAEVGELETELGPVGYLRRGPSISLLTPALVLNVGALRDLEIVAEAANGITFAPGIPGAHDALTDAALNLKYVLRRGVLQDGKGPSVATEIGALFPIGDEPGAGASALFIASDRWDPGTAHLNLGVSYSRLHEANVFAGLILEGPEKWPARPVLEAFTQYEKGQPQEFSLLVGSLFVVNEAVTIDAGIRLAHTDTLVGELRAGVTWTLPLWTPHESAAKKN